MADDTYTCALCKGVFQIDWSDEEVMEETQTYWPGISREECVRVCHDCYQQVSPEVRPDIYLETLLERYLEPHEIAVMLELLKHPEHWDEVPLMAENRNDFMQLREMAIAIGALEA